MRRYQREGVSDEVVRPRMLNQPSKAKKFAKAVITEADKVLVLRKAITKATHAFANQSLFVPIDPKDLTEQDRTIRDALVRLGTNSRSVQENVQVIAEALTGRKYDVPSRSARIQYNVLAAFVPLGTDNGHDYRIGKVSICIHGNRNGNGSVDITNKRLGGTPPETAKPNDNIQIRAATDEEIAQLTAEEILFVEGQAKLLPLLMGE